ncbi:PREDICTED: uncharacterized protein LOC105448508 [Wasmannia auropunctata]|uniref:uncharacterized protein LOC105448508 n=1 Tax=Wasmannia auropunctata TaxID=64793 RepID=UPI0005EE0BFA|nr:PREDICTED: uncharacterized protein LOC105448508 [Wasmannia auropunctata]
MPRKINSGFNELDFTLIKRNNKYYARCAYCSHDLTNTSFLRLKSHRSICKNTATTNQNSSHIDIHQEEVMIVDAVTSQDLSHIDVEEEIVFVNNTKQVSAENKENIPNNTALITKDYYVVPIDPLCDTDQLMDKTVPSSTPPSIATRSSSPRSSKRRKKNESLNSFLDKVSDKELNELHTKLCSFFFGCNIPFNVIESDHFKNFVKALRPAYRLHLPGRKALSSTLLEKEYERCLKMSKDIINPESVLLIDGWKNTSNNTKTVVTILHNAKGHAAFLNAWDVTSESETSDKLTDIVNKSIQLAMNLYGTTIYAVVSDNPYSAFINRNNHCNDPCLTYSTTQDGFW